MDKKKTLIKKIGLLFIALFAFSIVASAQNVRRIRFCDKHYEYGIGKDSITLYFNILDSENKPLRGIANEELSNYLVVYEDGEMIPLSRVKVASLNTGKRIPSAYTFSVLVDQSIPDAGKRQIFKAIEKLVESAPQGCVYLSFFGDVVTPTQVVTKENLNNFKQYFAQSANDKYFYGAMYVKLAEFNEGSVQLENEVITGPSYVKNRDISKRALENPDKNILFVFTEGHKSPSFEENISFIEVTEYQANASRVVPTVFAFYYTEGGQDAQIENVLMGVCNPHIEGRQGKYMQANDMQKVLRDFQDIVSDQMYDYEFTYRVTSSKKYFGKTTYTARWKSDEVGEGVFSIGTAERPWPEYQESTMDTTFRYLIALITTLLTIAFFFIIMKVLLPYIQSKTFELKYYKKYVPEANVSVRRCHYCKQEISEGQSVVVKCKHIIHVHCWKQNDYKCSEYGQNCKTGIQQHVNWSELFSVKAIRDCHQTISGIMVGLFCWIIFDFTGRGILDKASSYIVDTFYSSQDGLPNLSAECLGKTSAFLTIGLLLGFFLSLVFRYNDEYRNKSWKVVLKILALSIFTGIIGMIAFALGASILCSLLSTLETTYIPWYCSFPAYLLFSICIALALTLKSTIPVKSALIGGGISSIIGFIVLYFSSFAKEMNMLLDFIIYGGGLGASLVTIRSLAEKYFLVIQNGVKAGLRIPIHKWMNATGGGNSVSIGMAVGCEIQMNWEKSNKVAKEHAQLFIDAERQLPVIKPMATGVIYNTRAELPVSKSTILANGDTFKIGDTTFQYVETD